MITKKNVTVKGIGTVNFSIEENLLLKVAADELYTFDGKRPEEVFEDLVNGVVRNLTRLNSERPFTLDEGTYIGFSGVGMTVYAAYRNGVFNIVCVSQICHSYSYTA